MFCAKCGKELPAGAIVCPFCGTPVAGASAPPPSAPTASVSGFDALTKDQKAQDYWFRRVIAFIIDAIIVYVPLSIITFLVAFSYFFVGGFAFYALFYGTYTFLWSFIFILYNVVMETSSGASFGKRFFNLKVVNKSGQNPTAGESFIRNISKIYWLLLILDVIVGLATTKAYNQKYTDKLEGTSITSTKP
ncbi:MAG TPA: RDD family protein [Nitrososphaerales archaeon]|nr:RDD family protein [Nitrososphaerales archaeon]